MTASFFKVLSESPGILNVLQDCSWLVPLVFKYVRILTFLKSSYYGQWEAVFVIGLIILEGSKYNCFSTLLG